MYGNKKRRICNFIVGLKLITGIQFLVTFFEEFTILGRTSSTIDIGFSSILHGKWFEPSWSLSRLRGLIVRVRVVPRRTVVGDIDILHAPFQNP